MNKHSQVATCLWTIRLSEAYWFATKHAYALTYEPVSMVYFTYIVLSWLGHDWRFGVCNNEKVTWLWPMSMTAPRFIDHVASQFIFSVRHEGVAHSCCEEIIRISCRPRSAFRDSGWPRAREIPVREIPGAAATRVQDSVDSELRIHHCTGHLIALLGGTRHVLSGVVKT